jgi:dolichol kinase
LTARLMDREVLVRRLVHCLIALAPLYFLIPDDLPVIDVRRWVLLIIFFVGVSVFEAWRRWKKITFLGLRPHEKEQIASFAWAAAGITFVLWLIPKDLATATLIGMAFTDPLAGELRKTYGSRPSVFVASFAVYFLLAFSVLAIWADHHVTACAIIALAGALVAIPSEVVKLPVIDDDFVMLAVPGVVMGVLALYV